MNAVSNPQSGNVHELKSHMCLLLFRASRFDDGDDDDDFEDTVTSRSEFFFSLLKGIKQYNVIPIS